VSRTAPSPDGAVPAVLHPDPDEAAEFALLEEARRLGRRIESHRAVISGLAAQRKQALRELSKYWTPAHIARELGVSHARVTQLVSGRRKSRGRRRPEVSDLPRDR
jgi:hypothetical protein